MYPSIEAESWLKPGMEINFTYYLNTNRDDKNLEFLSSQNLYARQESEEALDNLNLIKKDRNSARSSKLPVNINFYKLSHYKGAESLSFVE